LLSFADQVFEVFSIRLCELYVLFFHSAIFNHMAAFVKYSINLVYNLLSLSGGYLQMGYKISHLIVKLIVHLFTRLEVYGLERVPRSGPFVVATNHLGRLDPLLVYYISDRKDIIMLVAEKYRKIAIARWFVKRLDAIFIDRYNADFAVLREALKRLKAGGMLVLAPEGTRSKTGALIEAHPGVSYLAAKAGVPIVPTALVGTEDKNVVASLRRLRRPKVVVRAGVPFTLPPLPGNARDAALQEYTDEIMCRIAALLPPSYRGVYADHPRLKELLESST
jgi:1-acyl-sn-glycerol-3-phosphate acyltransferase